MRLISAIWQEARKADLASDDCKLSKTKKELLTSNGSLTDGIESLLKATVTVELKETARGVSGAANDNRLCDFLGLSAATETLDRQVWLKVGGEKLVYAYSVFPVQCFDPEVLDTLSTGTETLGKILVAAGIEFTKEGLTVAVLDNEKVTGSLGLAGKPPFFVRRYRIEGSTNKHSQTTTTPAVSIKACVLEVLSSELFFKSLK